MTTAPEAPEVEPGLRVRTIAAVESLLRMLRGAVDAYGDLEEAVIYLTVAVASVGNATRDPALRSATHDAPLADEHFRPISRRAIALASGLPRETVRRKVARLVAAGHLVETEHGVRARSNIIVERDNLVFARELVREIERAAAILARPGPAPPT